MRSVGMTGSKWFTCDRCGFDYPVRFMRHQNGFQVCTALPCFDKIVTPYDPISDNAENEFDVDLEVIGDAF